VNGRRGGRVLWRTFRKLQRRKMVNAESATGNGSYKLSGPAYIAKLEIRENGARA
jgi:hypothetical protein